MCDCSKCTEEQSPQPAKTGHEAGRGTKLRRLESNIWGEGNLYNLDEMEREMIFYKIMKKKFFQLIQYLRKVRIT